ncbi:hypothetical protein L3X38_031320 [Prunus dulcis]|uniref:Uncharacterized protein n=1 Tax=Prunus dulcis TaxID=3755 RepID=A0AAD4VC98_PRUDU|nr:hypothetical protein L3X38_031320 [Prunus dulcis]
MHLSVWEFIIRLRSGVTASDNRFLRFCLFPYLTRLKPVIFRTKEWQPTSTLDEDGLMHQLRATLIQAIDASASKLPQANLQQTSQQNPFVRLMQESVDAITELQRLHSLMKGELVSFTELAEGPCLKNYEYLGSGEVYDKKHNVELPTASHLLLYLFCDFLEHSKWMRQVVDPDPPLELLRAEIPLSLG